MKQALRFAAVMTALALAVPTVAEARGGGLRHGGGGSSGRIFSGGSNGGGVRSGGFARSGTPSRSFSTPRSTTFSGARSGGFARGFASSATTPPSHAGATARVMRTAPSRTFRSYQGASTTTTAPTTTRRVFGNQGWRSSSSGATTRTTAPRIGDRVITQNGRSTFFRSGQTSVAPTAGASGLRARATTGTRTTTRRIDGQALERLRSWSGNRTVGTPTGIGTTVRQGTTASTPGDTSGRLRQALAGRTVRRGTTNTGTTAPTLRERLSNRFGGQATTTTGTDATARIARLRSSLPTRTTGAGSAAPDYRRGAVVRSGGIRTGGVRSGAATTLRSGSFPTGAIRRSSAESLASRAGVRHGGSHYFRGTDRAGVRYGGGYAAIHSGSARAGVRYARNYPAYYSGLRGGWYYSYGDTSYYHDWYGFRYYGYYAPAAYGGFWGVYWNPWWYSSYAPYWGWSLPPFGFGVVYYANDYTWLPSTTYVERPVVVQQNVVLQPGQRVIVDENGNVVVVQDAEAPTAPAEGPAPTAPLDQPKAPGVAEFQAGIEAFKAGDFETALNHFRDAANADETNGEAWMAVMHAAFAEGEYKEAAGALAVAAELGAFPRGYRFDPRPIYPDPRVFEGSLALLDRHIAEHPDDGDALLLRAYFHVAAGERSAAQTRLNQVLDLRPDDPTAPILTIAMLPPAEPQKAEGQAPATPVAPLPAPTK